MENVFDELAWRGLVYSYSEGLREVLGREKVTVYIGFDPTSDSLQVGNLLALMVLARMQRFGHTPIALAGGGTGLIGDPSGKQHERPLLSREQVEANVEAIKQQMARFLDFEARENAAIMENNADWLVPLSMMDFLRNVGKHFTVNYMLAKESVQSRLQRESGISYAEFSYMLLQAYDFLQLFDRYHCTLQAGGSDQWGNITAGIDLIRKVRGQQVHGLVYPLITDAEGRKLGKTEEGTIWLDPKRTSPYRFYQFWLNQGDAEIIGYLKAFTWMTREEIAEMEHEVATRPEQRRAQRTLARFLTRLVHGETALARAEQASRVLFGGDVEGLTAAEIADIFRDVPSSSVPKAAFEGEGLPLVELLITTGMLRSKSEGRRLIRSGGIYLNNVRVDDAERKVTLADAIEGQFIILRRGRKTYHLVRVQH